MTMYDFILDNVNFSLDGTHFFQDLALTFQAGKVHCISGNNGVGKSTFFRVIQGAIQKGEKISGSYLLNGNQYALESNAVPESFSMHVKVLSQNIDSLLVNTMTVSENSALAQLSKKSLLAPFVSEKIVAALLLKVGIHPEQLIEKLSGGQRQLLAFVMGYQNAGTIFLLDEPTAALDKENTVLLMDAITDLARTKNLIIIIITHDDQIIKNYCTGNHYQIVESQDRLRDFVCIL